MPALELSRCRLSMTTTSPVTQTAEVAVNRATTGWVRRPGEAAAIGNIRRTVPTAMQEYEAADERADARPQLTTRTRSRQPDRRLRPRFAPCRSESTFVPTSRVTVRWLPTWRAHLLARGPGS